MSRWPVAGPSEYWLLASSLASKVKNSNAHIVQQIHIRWQHTHTRQLQQYTRSTNNNYTQDSLKLIIVSKPFCLSYSLRFLLQRLGRPQSRPPLLGLRVCYSTYCLVYLKKEQSRQFCYRYMVGFRPSFSVCMSVTSARRTPRVTHPESVQPLARVHVHIYLIFRHLVISVFSVLDLFLYHTVCLWNADTWILSFRVRSLLKICCFQLLVK